jgi:hypothetical protein
MSISLQKLYERKIAWKMKNRRNSAHKKNHKKCGKEMILFESNPDYS